MSCNDNFLILQFTVASFIPKWTIDSALFRKLCQNFEFDTNDWCVPRKYSLVHPRVSAVHDPMKYSACLNNLSFKDI